MNAVEIEEAISNLASEPFDSENFSYQFLEAFGNKPTTITRLKRGNNNKSDVEGGVLQHNNIHIAVCSAGKVGNRLDELRNSPATKKQKAKFILATDGNELQAEDLSTGETVACEYEDFPNHFGFFLSLAGISTVQQIKENSFDIRATSRLNKLYIELLKENPEWGTEERRHDMNHFMARLIFCFFAEDTDIFLGGNLFTATVEQMSEGNGSNMHEVIGEIFRAMNTKPEEHKAAGIRSWADSFPYVNGGLFSGSTDAPRFSRMARAFLVHVGKLDWRRINPDIFGSMIQAVADDEERGALGMHYTSVPNILKVLNPLFLDDLRAQLEKAGTNKRKLQNLRKRIARIRVFDPACGSGNFLVIAYKQLREIEAEVNSRCGDGNRKSDIPLTNYRGIELRDFAAEIARLALIIAEYQCDVLYFGQKEALAVFLPLDQNNWITCGNALRIDWLSVCPPTQKGVKLRGDDLFSTPLDQAQIDFENEGGETYICGNPPYLGSRYQSDLQKSDLELIFKDLTNSWRSMDYVAGWFMKAVNYGSCTNSVVAFVATNSICQGQQVPILWPLIFKANYEIGFAHTSFRWANLASYNAGVTVVIIGLRGSDSVEKKIIYSERNSISSSKSARNINSYLIDADDIFIKKRSKQISGMPEMLSGDKLTDGGNLVLSASEYRNILQCFPKAKQFLGRLVGGQELIKGILRYALVIDDGSVKDAIRIPFISNRLSAVSEVRKRSSKESTRTLARFPHRFDESRFEKTPKIVIAQLSSEKRHYYPCDIVAASDVAMAPSLVINNTKGWIFGILVSRIHLAWIATVCGKLETRFRYSNTLGWNTFPLPPLTEKNKEDLTRCGEDILLAREAHFPKTIADLYKPEEMPEDLRHAHDRNDEVLERIYIGRKFKNDTERLEKLFELYREMTANKKPVSKKKKVAKK